MTYDKKKLRYMTEKCLLCHAAACDAVCSKNISVSTIIRSIRFDNLAGAASKIKLSAAACAACDDHACMKHCTRAAIDSPVECARIIALASSIESQNTTLDPQPTTDLSIDFCGLRCENPFFLSSSIVASNEEMIAKAFDMGWAGVAFKTIGTFVPKEVSPRFDVLDKDSDHVSAFKNIEQISDHPLEENICFIQNLKKRYPNKIIIASIMGQDEDEWTYLAQRMQFAGADIIECNFSCPHMSAEGMGSDVGANPEMVSLYTKATRRGTSLPILAKMTPNVSNMEIPAIAAIEAGADGIAAINTIKSIMNIDLESYASGPSVIGKSSIGGYSGKAVKPIALRFIHDLKKNALVKDFPLSGMGGIETWKDAAEYIALGCETIQVTTAVMLYGYRIIDDLIDGLSRYLSSHHYADVKSLVGKALPHLISAENLDRHSIEYPRFLKNRCVGCGRCYIACFDGGHQAIALKGDRKPVMNPQKCVGCQLCRLVCPTEAICSGKRIFNQKGK